MLRRAYTNHRRGAGYRGIGFELTFAEWLSIWSESGHNHEMGNRGGQYVMARHGDEGPYAVGNVKIITYNENCREQVYSPETRMKMSIAARKRSADGRMHSPEARMKISIAASAQARGADGRYV
jgi:hypothetical protein